MHDQIMVSQIITTAADRLLGFAHIGSRSDSYTSRPVVQEPSLPCGPADLLASYIL